VAVEGLMRRDILLKSRNVTEEGTTTVFVESSYSSFIYIQTSTLTGSMDYGLWNA